MRDYRTRGQKLTDSSRRRCGRRAGERGDTTDEAGASRRRACQRRHPGHRGTPRGGGPRRTPVAHRPARAGRHRRADQLRVARGRRGPRRRAVPRRRRRRLLRPRPAGPRRRGHRRDDRCRPRAVPGEHQQVSADYALPHADGTRWYHLQASRVDQVGHVVITHTDITARVEAEHAALWRARHDPLTELPNRARLHELIDAELQRPGRPAVTVLFLDVDGFKEVNDSLGHEVGDDLLRQLSERLTGRTRTGDTVGRLGATSSSSCAPTATSTVPRPWPSGSRARSTGRSTSAAAPPG